MTHEPNTAAAIIALERAALDRWGEGDPSGFLEISAPDVVYFDPFLVRRLDGLEALTRYYETLCRVSAGSGWWGEGSWPDRFVMPG